MGCENERGQTGLGDIDAQFLLQFTNQGGLGALAGLDLAAGEFPKTGQLLALRTLGDQHPSIRVDQGDGHHEDGRQGGLFGDIVHQALLAGSAAAVAATIGYKVWPLRACGLGRQYGKDGARLEPLHAPLAVSETLTSPELQAFAGGFPVLLLHAVVTLALLAAGATIYAALSPWKEIAQVRAGNPAATVAFAGVLLGLAIPLAVSLSVSSSAVDILIWGVVTVVLQLLAFRLVDLVLVGQPQRVRDGEVSAAVLLVAARLATALILAAALTG